MTDIYLDPATGDIDVSSAGVIRLTEGVLETVAQRLRSKLRTFLGEWFLDTTVGVPYFQSILGVPNPNLGVIRSIFLGVLLSDEDVDSVPHLEVMLTGRELSITCDVYVIDRQVTTSSTSTTLVTVASYSNPLIFFF